MNLDLSLSSHTLYQKCHNQRNRTYDHLILSQCVTFMPYFSYHISYYDSSGRAQSVTDCITKNRIMNKKINRNYDMIMGRLS